MRELKERALKKAAERFWEFYKNRLNLADKEKARKTFERFQKQLPSIILNSSLLKSKEKKKFDVQIAENRQVWNLLDEFKKQQNIIQQIRDMELHPAGNGQENGQQLNNQEQNDEQPDNTEQDAPEDNQEPGQENGNSVEDSSSENNRPLKESTRTKLHRGLLTAAFGAAVGFAVRTLTCAAIGPSFLTVVAGGVVTGLVVKTALDKNFRQAWKNRDWKTIGKQAVWSGALGGLFGGARLWPVMVWLIILGFGGYFQDSCELESAAGENQTNGSTQDNNFDSKDKPNFQLGNAGSDTTVDNSNKATKQHYDRLPEETEINTGDNKADTPDSTETTKSNVQTVQQNYDKSPDQMLPHQHFLSEPRWEQPDQNSTTNNSPERDDADFEEGMKSYQKDKLSDVSADMDISIAYDPIEVKPGDQSDKAD